MLLRTLVELDKINIFWSYFWIKDEIKSPFWGPGALFKPFPLGRALAISLSSFHRSNCRNEAEHSTPQMWLLECTQALSALNQHKKLPFALHSSQQLCLHPGERTRKSHISLCKHRFNWPCVQFTVRGLKPMDSVTVSIKYDFLNYYLFLTNAEASHSIKEA